MSLTAIPTLPFIYAPVRLVLPNNSTPPHPALPTSAPSPYCYSVSTRFPPINVSFISRLSFLEASTHWPPSLNPAIKNSTLVIYWRWVILSCWVLGGVEIEEGGGGDHEFLKLENLWIGECVLGRLANFGGWIYGWDRRTRMSYSRSNAVLIPKMTFQLQLL